MSRAIPHETERDDLTWGEVCGYLEALILSHDLIHVTVQRAYDNYTQDCGEMETIGYLSGGWEDKQRPGRWYHVDWPGPDDHVGSLRLGRDAFGTGSLTALDGSDYFWLKIPIGDLQYVIGDTNATGPSRFVSLDHQRHRREGRDPKARAAWLADSEVCHGLPHDTKRSGFSMNEACGYLNVLGLSRRPVSIAVTDSEDPSLDLEVTGYLGGGGFEADNFDERRYFVDWPEWIGKYDTDHPSRIASFTLPMLPGRRSIATEDGNKRFTLEIEAGSRTLRVSDAQTEDESA